MIPDLSFGFNDENPTLATSVIDNAKRADCLQSFASAEEEAFVSVTNQDPLGVVISDFVDGNSYEPNFWPTGSVIVDLAIACPTASRATSYFDSFRKGESCCTARIVNGPKIGQRDAWTEETSGSGPRKLIEIGVTWIERSVVASFIFAGPYAGTTVSKTSHYANSQDQIIKVATLPPKYGSSTTSKSSDDCPTTWVAETVAPCTDLPPGLVPDPWMAEYESSNLFPEMTNSDCDVTESQVADFVAYDNASPPEFTNKKSSVWPYERVVIDASTNCHDADSAMSLWRSIHSAYTLSNPLPSAGVGDDSFVTCAKNTHFEITACVTSWVDGDWVGEIWDLGAATTAGAGVKIAAGQNSLFRERENTPSSPNHVVAFAGDGTAKITWSPPAADGGSGISGYVVSTSPNCSTCSGLEIHGDPPSTFTTVAGLHNGTTYSFTVAAQNGFGLGQYSTNSNYVTPYTTCTPLSDYSGTIPDNELPLVSGIAQGNPWNTTSANGSIVLCNENLGLQAVIGLNSIDYAKPGPAGYAEAAFGKNYEDNSFCIQTCPVGPFPLSYASLSKDVPVVQAAYTTTSILSNSMPFDWGLDLWMEKQPSAGIPPNKSTDTEILIEPYNNGLAPPGCSLTTTLVTTIKWDGTSTPSTWRVCDDVGGAGVNLTTFVLKSPRQSFSATVALPLLPFVNEASKVSGLDLTQNVLMGVEFGTEYGNWSYSGNVQLSWTISSLSLSGTTRNTIYLVGQ